MTEPHSSADRATQVNTDIIEYYARRAAEYDRVYLKPERQDEIARLRALFKKLVTDRDVLEVACGTGYWTRDVAETARSVLATDVNPAVLEIARRRPYPKDNVRFMEADAYTLAGVSGRFTAGFAGFWWSHIPVGSIRSFLDVFRARLDPGAVVVLADNTYVEGDSHPITRRDDQGNTFQLRTLEDNTTHEVLKNYPTEQTLRSTLADFTPDISYTSLTYYWCVSYILTPSS